MSADEQLEPHESLWYEDGNLAQNMLFKVHRGVLVRRSELIKDVLALPSSNEQEGTVACPLFLPEVSAAGLADLLKMMYNLWGSELSLSDDEFVEVLLTAHRLQVHDAVKIVLGILDSRLPAERKLQLGLQCDLEFWQLCAFRELVLDFHPMPIRETPLLSQSIWLKVYLARSQLGQARIDKITSALGGNSCGHIVAALLCSVPFASPMEYKTKYETYRRQHRRLPAAIMNRDGYLESGPHHPCCSSTKIVVDGGPGDTRFLLPNDTVDAMIAVVWNSLPPRLTNEVMRVNSHAMLSDDLPIPETRVQLVQTSDSYAPRRAKKRFRQHEGRGVRRRAKRDDARQHMVQQRHHLMQHPLGGRIRVRAEVGKLRLYVSVRLRARVRVVQELVDGHDELRDRPPGRESEQRAHAHVQDDDVRKLELVQLRAQTLEEELRLLQKIEACTGFKCQSSDRAQGKRRRSVATRSPDDIFW
ncbi:hypothetical protein AURDEDRAFT_127569 [Auricularia subglabra TFB-10046 SS5]|nr:hypothetical protein AURDEDRAFT_127569 [Auricularia subglabra TFB-10046 SS5]